MRWPRRFGSSSVEPQPAGPRGRLLFVGPFNGGIGGMERLTKIFADWARDSGFGVTMICTNTFAPGPFSVSSGERVRVLGDVWNRALARADYDFVYVMPAGLRARRWLPRLARIAGVRVVLDLDPRRKFLTATDVLHCETPRDDELSRPHVVALPDPRPTLPDPEDGALPPGLTPGGFDLTVFTPYGTIKGHADVPRFAEASPRPLAWCYDPVSFSQRRAKYGAKVARYLAEAEHPNVVRIEAASQGRLRQLYDASAGYVCFSQGESYGFAIADAVALGKPLCARRVGFCRALPAFQATTDFAKPVFGRYAMPDAPGYEGLFATLEQRKVERVR